MIRTFYNQHGNTSILLLLLTILTLLFMWPRLESAQLGLLDDAVSITMSKHILNFPMVAFSFQRDAGRFVPGYWWITTLIFRLASFDPLRAFWINWLLLLGSVIGIFYYARWRGDTNLQSFLAGFFFCLSAPALENYYTLSKPEPYVVFFIMAGFMGVALIQRSQRTASRCLLCIATFTSFLLAYTSKEPTIVLLGIVIVWFFFARFIKKTVQDRMDTQATTNLIMLVWTSGIVFILGYLYIYHGLALDRSYTSNYQITASSISSQTGRWLAQIIRNFSFLVPLSFLLISRRIRSLVNQRFLLDNLIWMCAWMVVFLPWQVLDHYHLLPFTVGVAWFAGSLAGAGIQILISQERQDKLWISVCLIVSMIFLLSTLMNAITFGKTQLTFDETNQRMLEMVAKVSQKNTIYFNTPPVEYYFETGLHLQNFYQRPVDSIRLFNYQRPGGPEPVAYSVVSPVVENLPIPGVRNSLQNENKVSQWKTCLETFLLNRAPVFEERTVKTYWYDIDPNRFLHNRWNFPNFIGSNDNLPTVASDQMLYGWKLYKYDLDPKRMSKEGVFKKGTWNLRTLEGERPIQGFGQANDVPLSGDFDGDVWTDIGVFRPSEQTFFLDTDLDGKTNLTVKITGMLSNDLPLVGDWDGDGTDTLGYYRPSDKSWNILNQNESGDIQIRSVISNMKSSGAPLSGDWNGDGFDTFGVYLPETGDVRFVNDLHPENSFEEENGYQGLPHTIPVSADWYGLGQDTIAYVEDGVWVIWPNNARCEFANPLIPSNFGQPGDLPVAGIWRPR